LLFDNVDTNVLAQKNILSMVAWVCTNGHCKCSNHHQPNFQIEHFPYNIFALTLNI